MIFANAEEEAAAAGKVEEDAEGKEKVDNEKGKKKKKNDDKEDDDKDDDDDEGGSSPFGLGGAIPSTDDLTGSGMDFDAGGATGVKAPTLPVEEDEPTDEMSEEQQKEVKESKEKHGFHAEVHRLMDIIINSLYSQKEVFLRELVSNSADALEKIRILSLKDSDVLGSVRNLDIRIEFNKEAKTLSITDTGIGMTKSDLINNLGTVAKSGTTNFLEAIAQGSASDANLIGQFGVGFYSVFLVADRVSVTSKHNDDDSQYIWESSADAFFSIAKDPRGNTLGRGTRITLFMKEDATTFLNEFQIVDLLNRYSRFISFPIYLKKEKTVTVEEEEEDDEDKKKDGDGEEKKEGDDVDVKDAEDEGKKGTKKKVDKKVKEYEQVNLHKAIWMRPKDEVTLDEYNEFYKAISKDYAKPLTHIHFSAEGEIEFKALIYIPEHAPRDMFNNYFQKQTTIKLYVRRVLVADKFDDLMPKYLHFVTGVVDSDDLPLNVSREHLQQHKLVKVISKKLVRKTLELMKKLMKDSEKERKELQEKVEAETEEDKKKELKRKLDQDSSYDKFLAQYSRNLKLGCYEDVANRAKLLKLLKFPTSKSDGKKVSLDQYVESMNEKQKAIYFASGESIDQIAKLPQLQAYLRRDFEVLYLTESMDEPCLSSATDYEGKKFESIQKGDMTVDMTDDEKKREKKLKKMYEPLMKWWKQQLGMKAMKVEVSRRLVDAPCSVTASQYGYSAYMEKMMKSQTFADQGQFQVMRGQKSLEVNPNHSIIKDLLRRVNENPQDDQAKSTAQALFDTALLASGFDPADPQELSRRLYKSVAVDLGLSPSMPVEEVELSAEEPEEAKGAGDEEAGDEQEADADGGGSDEDGEKSEGEDNGDGKKGKDDEKKGEDDEKKGEEDEKKGEEDREAKVDDGDGAGAEKKKSDTDDNKTEKGDEGGDDNEAIADDGDDEKDEL